MKITQRSSKNHIVFTETLQAISKTIPLKISAPLKSWEELHLLAIHDRDKFVRQFLLDVIFPTLKTASFKGPKNHERKVDSISMKVLSALLFVHFKQKKSRDPVNAAIRKMAQISPEKRNIFHTSFSNEKRATDVFERFRIGYISDGKKC